MNDIDDLGIGEGLRQTRIASGHTLETLAHELQIPVHILNAIETETWSAIPPGRERPLTRLVARHLGFDLEHHKEAFETLPGGLTQEQPNPWHEKLERIFTGIITLVAALLTLWLVIPGGNLRKKLPQTKVPESRVPPPTFIPKTYTGPYPVLGEVLPEAGVTKEGVLINIRAVEPCTIHITGSDFEFQQVMKISEPWKIRLKAPLTLNCSNACAIALEVAGRSIQLTQSVGQPWTGYFAENGDQVFPSKQNPKPPLMGSAPDSDTEETDPPLADVTPDDTPTGSEEMP